MTPKNLTYWAGTKFGSLKMQTPIDVGLYSHKKVDFVCDCGKITNIPVRSVTTGNTKSCGKCNLLSADYFRNARFGKLRMQDPQEYYKKSHSKVWWVCDCGKITKILIQSVTSGHTTSCGKCDFKTTSHFENTKFGKLQMKEPKGSFNNSHQKTEWICDCGNSVFAFMYAVTSGHTTSCGKCDVLPISYWENTKFNNLKMAVAIPISSGSNKKVLWDCLCGGSILSDVYTVTKGKTTRCNQCRTRASDWFHQHKMILRSLKTPIQPGQIPPGWFIALEPAVKYCKPFRAICAACKSEYAPIWGNIVKGSSLTCGCTTNHISHAQRDIARYLESLGLDVILEYRVSAWKYDIYIPDSKCLIEYQGLRWHSIGDRRKQEFEKYQNAIKSGFRYLMIFEDEWLFNEIKIQNLLKNKLGLNKSLNLRPSQCKIQSIQSMQTDLFYDQFHYIGKCNAKVHFGVFYESKLIAAISFSNPTRQTSSHPWELIRMGSDPAYRVHGIWSKLLKLFIKTHNPKSLVSFSDNRLFFGNVYQKIGFQLDGEIRPDYYWVKGNKRYHKSGLRKTKEEIKTGLTETQLRESQGYKRIWDLGKKRWVLSTSY